MPWPLMVAGQGLIIRLRCRTGADVTFAEFSIRVPELLPRYTGPADFRTGEWFHNIDLHGIKTAPNHFLGDFPNVKWRHISPAIPQDLSGATVLDIGCNGGFYSSAR